LKPEAIRAIIVRKRWSLEFFFGSIDWLYAFPRSGIAGATVFKGSPRSVAGNHAEIVWIGTKLCWIILLAAVPEDMGSY
jgi:hypothetical protein